MPIKTNKIKNMKKYSYLIVFLIILLVGVSYLTLNSSRIIKQQQEQLNEQQVIIENQKQNLELESVLTNYKIDAQNGNSKLELLLEGVYNSPSQSCSSIVANQTTKQHLYYLVLDDLNSLENKYGKYRNEISYIENNLNGLWGILETVKNKCESVGFKIE